MATSNALRGEKELIVPQYMSREKIEMFCAAWQRYMKTLEGEVDAELLSSAQAVVKPENFKIGGGWGSLTPIQEHAQWGVYDWFVPVRGCDDMYRICGLHQYAPEFRQALEQPDFTPVETGDYELTTVFTFLTAAGIFERAGAAAKRERARQQQVQAQPEARKGYYPFADLAARVAAKEAELAEQAQ